MTPAMVDQINLFRAHVDLLSTCLDDLVATMRRSTSADKRMVEMTEHHIQHGFECMRRVFPAA